MSKELLTKIESLETPMVEALGEMISYPAISPLDGGEGEFHKAQYLLKKIKELGFEDVKVYASSDPQAAGGERPNIIVRFPGRSGRRLWIVAHTDVVPEGERSLWETDPFKAVVKDGRIYGRGVNDNGQEVIASLYGLFAIKELGLTPEYEVCLAFVADEEVGSTHGIKYLIKKGLFDKDDLVVVPDMGTEEADFIEIAEKSICWMEFTVEGKQVHASLPNLGVRKPSPSSSAFPVRPSRSGKPTSTSPRPTSSLTRRSRPLNRRDAARTWRISTPCPAWRSSVSTAACCRLCRLKM